MLLRISIAVVALLALALLVALASLLRDRKAASRRVESWFRRPERPAHTPEPGHYYRPYWS
jgi:hypothetical protein